jgi:hypothetical protein
LIVIMSDQQLRAFNHAQTNLRIQSVVLVIGLIASLVMAFPLMIGLKYALVHDPMLFPLPFVAAVVLVQVIKLVRNRAYARRAARDF